MPPARRLVFSWVSEAGRGHRLEVVRERTGRSGVVSVVDVDGWRVVIRLALQRGRVVASALRVTPATNALPAAGLTTRILTRIPVHAHMRALGELMRRPGARRPPVRLRVPPGSKARLHGTLADAFAGTDLEGLGAASPLRKERRGRQPISIEVLLDVAAAYAAAASDGSPTQATATRLGIPPARARDLVYRARQRGFLTLATWGRPGGALTRDARALLRRRDRTTAASPRPRRKRR